MQTEIATYWATIANTDVDADTIRELIDTVLQNQTGLQAGIGRYDQDIGDGVATAISIAHNLNSLDVVVSVFEKATGKDVGVDIARTSVNIVTITTNSPMATGAFRIVIKK